jgi:hypothetical protein
VEYLDERFEKGTEETLFDLDWTLIGLLASRQCKMSEISAKRAKERGLLEDFEERKREHGPQAYSW